MNETASIRQASFSTSRRSSTALSDILRQQLTPIIGALDLVINYETNESRRRPLLELAWEAAQNMLKTANALNDANPGADIERILLNELPVAQGRTHNLEQGNPVSSLARKSDLTLALLMMRRALVVLDRAGSKQAALHLDMAIHSLGTPVRWPNSNSRANSG